MCADSRLEATVVKAVAPFRGRRLLVGVSGGADSVALLLALKSAGAMITVANCNFHLRGQESDRDSAFVASLVRRLEVPLVTVDFDVQGWIAEHHMGVEEACRRLRYDWFDKECRRLDCVRLAVAHNSDDNAENMMLALMRGAGLRGLKGMVPDNGRVIRPLLSISRREIEAYLTAKGEKWITDSTNLESDYGRNFIRNRVFPLLQERWPGAKESILRSQANLRADFGTLADFMKSYSEERYLPYDCLRQSNGIANLVYHFIESYGGTAVQADEIAGSVSAGRIVGKRWNLPTAEVVGVREGLRLIVESDVRREQKLRYREIMLDDEKVKEIKSDRSNRRLYVSGRPEEYACRLRSAGDRIEPLGMKGSMLVSDIVKDAKVEEPESRYIHVVEHLPEGKIIWVEGLKRSRHCLVDLTSQTCLELTLVDA